MGRRGTAARSDRDGLEALARSPRRGGLGPEGKRHGEADEVPSRGRLEGRQSGQAPLQLESSSPKEKGTTPGLRLYSLPSQCVPPTAPRTALPSVLGMGLLPEQLGMQISTCEAKSPVRPHQAATPQAPRLAVPPGSLTLEPVAQAGHLGRM